ncbi:MAG: polysaccharide lyase [Hyphomicrobium sp.]|jgi:hypothetical protein
MDSAKHLQLMINTAGVVVSIFIVGYVAYAALRTEVDAPCSARFPPATRFSLQNSSGKPLTAIELQARAGLRDLGVIDNASVVSVGGAPSAEALQVKLRPLPAGADTDDKDRNGIEFRWAPRTMGNASSACLSYSLLLPDKFPFGNAGGFLPGVFGGMRQADASANAVYVQPQWDSNGRPLMVSHLQSGDIHRTVAKAEPLPTGRWTKIEQEIELNEPGKANGRVRLWIDGQLAIEAKEVEVRKDATVALSGVLAAVGYRQLPPQPQPGSIQMSPFEVSWR